MKKKILLGGLAAGLVLAFSPMASADPGDVTHGGCFFNTDKNTTVTQGHDQGVIGDRSVTTHADNTPLNAKVDCWIEINGVSQGVHTFGDGTAPVQAGADQISFDTVDGDLVNLCQQTHYGAGDGDSTVSCPGATQIQIPPQVVIDTVNGLFSGTIDPAVCPILKAHAGTYGPITIEGDDGDVVGPDPLALGLNPYDDCPPYGDNV